MRAPRFNPLHLAGWLFADMLLVLALVAMGDQGDPLAAEASTGPKATASPKSGPSKAPAPKGPRAVTRTPVKVSFDAPPGDRAAMREQLRKVTLRYEGRQAAFVLTFGHHPEPGPGGDYAADVNSQLVKARPDMFKGATTRDFWKGASSGGHADLEIYFYTY
ncbi:hypothetical protein [Streptomyces sp. NPDC088915]|uniref:hypothetical protein n=1 Tax=Streptomyces sp. NPDC088915 TaxID=3365912 RepID=UPI0038150EAB